MAGPTEDLVIEHGVFWRRPKSDDERLVPMRTFRGLVRRDMRAMPVIDRREAQCITVPGKLV